MGCGISKSDLKSDLEEGQTVNINIIRIKSSIRRNGSTKDHEFDSNHRKSVSSIASEGGFLRKVIGSNENESGVERELEPNERISIASSSLKEDNKEPLYLETLERDDQFIQNNPEMIMHSQEEFIRPSNVEDCSSILLSPGSPSFRVYCAPDEHINVHHPYEDDGDQEREDIKSLKEEDKEIERGVEKTGRRRRRFRNAFGRSTFGLRKKTLLSQSHKHSLPSKLIPKPSG